MGDSHQQQQPRPPPSHPRLGRPRGGAGEIVEVQGGHIVRSTDRKDRHSKVCTAKGLRDRRVRLSAHTAIQFYDVQDRLGYDRPSKAVDWLIKNAKPAIDELDELPPWQPTTTHQPDASKPPATANSSKKPAEAAAAEPAASAEFGFGGGFLPASLDSDSIADTIKSFFPIAATSATPSSSSSPISYQDLRLSLQSFQDPIFHHQQDPTPPSQQTLFDIGSAGVGWPDENQRMVPWNLAESSGGSGGYVFSVPPPPHSALGQSQFFTQRGPLQSSNSPSVRAWIDPIGSAAGHQMHPAAFYPSLSAVPAIGFSSAGGDGFSGFCIPARLQGEEEHGGISEKPPSAPSASRQR